MSFNMIGRGHHILGGFTSSSHKKRRNSNVSSNKFTPVEPLLVKFPSDGPWASTRSKVAKNYLEEISPETGPYTRTRSNVAKKYLAAEIKSNIEKNYLIATTSGRSYKSPISNENILVSKKNSETLFGYIIKNTFTLRNLLYLLFFIFISFIGYVGYVFLDVMFLEE
jgi:hypothetical protein